METILLFCALLPFSLCNSVVYVDTPGSSKSMEKFSSSVFNIWESRSGRVDILNGFEGRRCLISLTNFMNSPIMPLTQPVLIRKPIPAIIKYGKESFLLGWVMKNRLTLTNESDSFVVDSISQSVNCYSYAECAMFDFEKVIRKSKLWTCEVRIDLFPPSLEKSAIPSEVGFSKLYGEYLLSWDNIWSASFMGH